jgi:iron complex transport system substrate-binding protein
MTRRLLAVLLPVLLAATIACERAAPPPASVRGPRVVSLVPAATEMLFAIGAGPQVVGVSSFDREPPEVEGLPRVGALLDPDLERILELRPDLVVTYGSQEALEQQLAQTGIASFAFRHGGLGDMLATMEALGERTGHAESARMAANVLRARFSAVRMRVEGEPRRRAMLVFGRERGSLRQIWASGGTGFLHDLLELAGADNVFADVPRENVQVSTELLLGAAPDVIIELRREAAPGDEADPAWQAVPAVPAVRDGRIHRLDGDVFVIPGPRLAEAAERLAAALHGW